MRGMLRALVERFISRFDVGSDLVIGKMFLISPSGFYIMCLSSLKKDFILVFCFSSILCFSSLLFPIF